MVGYHTGVSILPGSSYGVIVLMGGHYPDAAKLIYDAYEIFQPAMDSALRDLSSSLYTGSWRSEDGKSYAEISIDTDTLYVNRFVVDGIDILGKFFSNRLPLRSTGRYDELRYKYFSSLQLLTYILRHI